VPVLRLFSTALLAISLLLALTAASLAADDPVTSPTPDQHPEASPSPAASPTPAVTPTETPSPTQTPNDVVVGAFVDVYPVIDRDGDPTTETDWLQGLPGWEFVADFGTAQIDSAFPVSDELGTAFWSITYTVDTPVTITEHVPEGYTLIDVRCEWSETDESLPEPVPTTLDRDTVTWTARVGTGIFHDFWCFFVNFAASDEPLPTLPPTDAVSGATSAGANIWRIELLGLGTLIALSVLRHRTKRRPEPVGGTQGATESL
jgi:hypothetical protein